MCFSKLSVIFFIRNVIPPLNPDRFIIGALVLFTVLWAGIGILTAALQCPLPRAWDYLQGRCIQRGSWWIYMCAMDIVTDTGVMAHGIFIVVRLQMRLKRKLTLIVIFALRTCVIAASACQAFYANQAVKAPDPTFDTSLFAICTQVTQGLSLITCCSPQFKPFIDNLRSLGFYVDGVSRHGASGVKHEESMTRSQKPPSPSCPPHELGIIDPCMGSYQATVTASSSKREWDAESQSSQAHIIQEAYSWAVTSSARETFSRSLQ
ncbi:hypothetical protein BDV26DRAFT_105075 [Aspergillus bertholletiae]|uniref:Rhodopsin domain-containing protein n=1 Tax=Aspergillus bertholletiae TaxID=1226010 RepID=A0A5N7AQU9_9EURO|nr:hypothetical protein BDV26DRAFT_105075 [Aspergillus bertholletiae]